MHTYAHHQHSMRKASGEAPHVRPTSFLKTLGTALSSKALTCHISTAAANEHVPSNDSGFLIPFWQVRGGELAGRGSRLLMFHLHCKCWLLPCAAALSPAVQLRCFLHSCRHPGGRLLLYLAFASLQGGSSCWNSLAAELVVCTAAAVGALRSMIVGWEDVKLFS